MIYLCKYCGIKKATGRHHKFPDTVPNRRYYTKKLLDQDFNIELACQDCHTSHSHIPKTDIWDEKKFRKEAKKHGFNLPLPKKSYKFKV